MRAAVRLTSPAFIRRRAALAALAAGAVLAAGCGGDEDTGGSEEPVGPEEIEEQVGEAIRGLDPDARAEALRACLEIAGRVTNKGDRARTERACRERLD